MSNLFVNRLSAVISDADLQRITANLADAQQTMPFLVGLTERERRRLPKIRRDNRLFVEEAVQALDENQTWLPGYVNPLEIRKDFQLYNRLKQVELILGQLYEWVVHTRILAGSESYQGCLLFYRMAKQAAQSGVPGAQHVVTMLRERFQTHSGGTHDLLQVNEETEVEV